MENSFSSYTPEELIGKTVLHQSGQTYNTSLAQKLRKIDKVRKTYFTIEGDTSRFSLVNGEQQGLSGRMNMGTVSRCQLMSEEEADGLRQVWAQQRKMKQLKQLIQESLEILSLEQLTQMAALLTPETK